MKSGKPRVVDVRDLRGVVEREGAEIGVLITLHAPTRDMLSEAASAGFYTSPWRDHRRIQILTIEQLLDGRGIDYPPARHTNVTLRKPPKARVPEGETLPLPGMARAVLRKPSVAKATEREPSVPKRHRKQ